MRLFTAFAIMLLVTLPAAAGKPSIEDFVKFPEFTSVVISPDGKHLAVAMPEGGQTGLQIIDISDPAKGLKSKAAYRFPKLEHVSRINWANDTRVVFETTREYDLVGDIHPRLTGTIYAMDADGSAKDVIHGDRRGYNAKYGSVVDTLRDDDEHVLIYRKHYGKHSPQIVELNVYNGSERVLATSPFDRGGFILDGGNVARVAYKFDGMDESLLLAWRDGEDEEWQTRTLEKEDAFIPRGFMRDGRTLVVERQREPLGFYAYDFHEDVLRPLLVHETVEPDTALGSFDGRFVIGATFHDGLPENRYFDSEDRETRIRQMLDQSFAGASVEVTSSTRDGRKLVLAVAADRMPFDYYLFDTEENRADFLLSSYQWLDPAELAERRPVTFTARDGEAVHGYLTLPVGMEPKDLPMVALVHGGPHGIRDYWHFDYEAQLLASRGYAVLQVNYRGSGGYGKAYEEAGWLNWGRRTQDDIADGVNWAVGEGIADEDRLCIYGASFGGYSVLSQLTRDPELFKCGFAFVGIYDLEHMFKVGDVQFRNEGEAFLERVLGTDEETLRAQSPVHHVSRIKAELFVAHGREDERAHYSHYGLLTKALDRAGIPYEGMVKHKEAHGFIDMDNRIELYTKLVEFVDEHIGHNAN